jgi:gliding motility-associated-like protein
MRFSLNYCLYPLMGPVFLLSVFLLANAQQAYSQCTGIPISVFPYHEDFEAGAGGWAAGGTNNDWALGTPNKSVINTAGSGTKCWVTGGLTGSSYGAGERSYVLSPCFNFTLLSHPYVQFKIFWESEHQFDGSNLQYSLDGGNTWTTVGSAGDPADCLNDNWYNYTPINYLVGLATVRDGWSGNKQPGSGSCQGGSGSNGWVTARHCMQYLAGKPSVRFRFTFGAGTTCNNFDGVAFDDFYIQNAPAIGVSFGFSCSSNTTYNFTDLSINCPDTWTWNFGDPGSGAQNTSTAQNPTHTFPGPGIYNVNLKASSMCSGTSMITLPVTVLGLTAVPTDPGCNGANTGSATIQVTPTGITPGFYWSTTPQQFTQTATNLGAGTYTVTVTATSACPATASVTLTQPPPLQHTVTAAPAACGHPTGTATISETGGTTPYAYNWSPAGGNGPTASNLGPGNYVATVTDAHGCTDTVHVAIANVPGVQASIGASTNVQCNGGTTGSAMVNAVNGTMPYSYAWSPTGGNAPDANNLSQGVYTVTVTDANHCTSTASVSISQPPPFQHQIQLVASDCGISNGSILISESGSVPPYSYNWAPSVGSTNFADHLAPGVYHITVTDQSGCIDTISAQVTQLNGPVVNIINSKNITCFGDKDGSLTAQVIAGPGSALIWSYGGLTSPTISGLPPGTYTVTVTQMFGCTATATATLTEPPVLYHTSVLTPAICGQGDGAIMIYEFGGNGMVTASWSTPLGNGLQASGLTPGIYGVTITDLKGCTDTVQVVIENIPSIQADFEANYPVTCHGGSDGHLFALGTVGLMPYSYNWSTGENQDNIDGLSAGVYTVTITDANQCTASATAIVKEPPAITHSYTTTPAACIGANGSATVSVSGGTAPYTYKWPNGNTGPTASNLASGTYIASITDQHNCQDTVIVQVGNQGGQTVAISATTPANCNGSADGIATVTVNGGTPPFVYNWSPTGGSGPTAGGLTAGVYFVTVVDANQCVATASTQINQPPAFQHSVVTQSVKCNGSNGSATITESGGTGAYTYTWSPTGGSANTATNLSAGNYVVSVHDQHGCLDTIHLTIGSLPAVQAIISNISPVSCYLGTDGTATVTASSGVPPYTYNWGSWGGNVATVTGLPQGNYTVTVTDANQCVAVAVASVAQPAQMKHVPDVKPVNCNMSNGAITITESGGTSPYTYKWSTPLGNGNMATGLSTGNYTVTVTDQHGCTDQVSILITNIPGVQAVIGNTADAKCFGSQDGSATVAPSAGLTPYAYSWSAGGSTTATATGLGAGAYTVTVTDANLCTAIATAQIAQPAALQHSAQITGANCTGSGGSATITETGGTPGFTYTWSPAVSTGPSATGLAPGAYAVTATDSHGCIDTFRLKIIALAGITAISATATDQSCHNTLDGSIKVATVGGAGPFAYHWSPTGTGATASSLAAGQYYVTVTDATGCTAVDSAIVSAPPPLAVRLHSLALRCYGDASGMVAIDSVLGGKPPYRYAIGQAAFQPQSLFTGLTAGDYVIRFQDSLGCIDMQTVTVLTPPQHTVSAGADTTIYLGDVLQLIGTTNAGPDIHVNWKPPLALQCDTCLQTAAKPVATTTYTIFVTDSSGCVVSDMKTVQVAQPPIYIPNIFDPASAFQNDHFTIYAGTNVDEVELMQVYDRWGDLLFENRHFPASVSQLGWDGRAKGDLAPAGVYVYLVKVKFLDGTSKTYSGDVTIVR